MNNKGFTLIEILVVIALIASLGVIVTINLTKTLNDNEENNCNSFIKDVEDAACVYVGTHKEECTSSGCFISLDKIIKEGLINTEIDACTKEEINKNDTVEVTFNDGEKICTYKRGDTDER